MTVHLASRTPGRTRCHQPGDGIHHIERVTCERCLELSTQPEYAALDEFLKSLATAPAVVRKSPIPNPPQGSVATYLRGEDGTLGSSAGQVAARVATGSGEAPGPVAALLSGRRVA